MSKTINPPTSTPAPVMMPTSLEGFDLDLLSLFPDLIDQGDVAAAAELPVWVHASTAARPADGVKVMAHPACWNHYYGMHAPYFTAEPTWQPGAGGFYNVGGSGYVTQAGPVCVSALAAVRDTWVHHLYVSLNGEAWMSMSARPLFEDLMYDQRGWKKHPNAEDLRHQARQWAIAACVKARSLIG